MTAIPFLQNSAFGPDEITAMDEAFVNVCATLRISERAGGLTEQVALSRSWSWRRRASVTRPG
jgi:hypothetical protein